MIAIILLPIFFGLSILFVLKLDKLLNIPILLALSFALGTGVITQWMLILGILQIPFSSTSINLSLSILSLILLVVRLYSKEKLCEGALYKDLKPGTKNIHTIILLLFLFATIVCIFIISMTIPVLTWDAVATHAFNAKIFYYEKSLTYLPNMPHYTYPCHIPFILSWAAFTQGEWDSQSIKIIFPLMFLSFVFIKYYFLRLLTDRNSALIGTGLLCSSFFFVYHATICYRDFTMCFYIYTCLASLCLWSKFQKTSFLVLAGLFAGFVSFIKLEGTGYAVILALILFVMLILSKTKNLKKKIISFFTFTLISWGIAAIYHCYKYFIVFNSITDRSDKGDFDLNHIQINFSLELFQRLTVLAQKYLTNLFSTNNWSTVWPIFFICLLKLKRKNISPEMLILFLFIALHTVIYTLGYTLTQHFIWLKTDTALSRSILHIFPIIPALIAMILSGGQEHKANGLKR